MLFIRIAGMCQEKYVYSSIFWQNGSRKKARLQANLNLDHKFFSRIQLNCLKIALRVVSTETDLKFRSKHRGV